MCTMKLRSYSKYLPNKTALVTTSTFIKSADGNATYLVCCKSLMPVTLSIGPKNCHKRACKVADDRNATYWNFVKTLILSQSYMICFTRCLSWAETGQLLML